MPDPAKHYIAMKQKKNTHNPEDVQESSNFSAPTLTTFQDMIDN
jgi:hypothetical protein